MRRGSTPTLSFAVNLDLTTATVYITFKQSYETLLDKCSTDSSMTVTADTITLSLTQEETVALESGACQCQIRYKMPSGVAGASDIMTVDVKDILKDGVI